MTSRTPPSQPRASGSSSEQGRPTEAAAAVCFVMLTANWRLERSDLVHGFDEVPAYCLDSLFTLRCKVLPGRGVVECLRLLEAIPFGDRYTLGRCRPLNCN